MIRAGKKKHRGHCHICGAPLSQLYGINRCSRDRGCDHVEVHYDGKKTIDRMMEAASKRPRLTIEVIP